MKSPHKTQIDLSGKFDYESAFEKLLPENITGPIEEMFCLDSICEMEPYCDFIIALVNRCSKVGCRISKSDSGPEFQITGVGGNVNTVDNHRRNKVVFTFEKNDVPPSNVFEAFKPKLET